MFLERNELLLLKGSHILGIPVRVHQSTRHAGRTTAVIVIGIQQGTGHIGCTAVVATRDADIVISVAVGTHLCGLRWMR